MCEILKSYAELKKTHNQLNEMFLRATSADDQDVWEILRSMLRHSSDIGYSIDRHLTMLGSKAIPNSVIDNSATPASAASNYLRALEERMLKLELLFGPAFIYCEE